MSGRLDAEAALGSESPSVEPSHLGVDPGFVEKDETSAVPAALNRAPLRPGSFYVGSVLFGGTDRFFLKVSPIASKRYQSALTPSLIPSCSSRR